EARAGAAGIDPQTAAWAMMHLQQFLDSLRAEAERNATATVEVAEHRARVRREDAARLAQQLRNGAEPTPLAPVSFATHPPVDAGASTPPAPPAITPAVGFVGPDGDGATGTRAAPDDQPPASATATQAPPRAPVMVPVELPVPSPITPLDRPPEPPPTAPARFPPVAAPTRDSSSMAWPPPTGAQVHEDALEPESGELSPTVAPTFQPPPPVQQHEDGPPADAPWTTRRARRRRSRMPLSAIIEVIVVLMILVFILLRLS
ncbi:MAG TPA: hypothetical protein VEP49_21835, partial [Acidimicrobiia bacterium]|nr:hypothetical protein [Acidimicrobiia bacterium]